MRGRRLLAGLTGLLLMTGIGAATFRPQGVAAQVSKGVKADFVLTPHAPPVIKHVTTVLVNNPALAYYPDGCRTSIDTDAFCDAYRIKLNRNMARGAHNAVVITLTWAGRQVPDLPLVVTAPGLGFLPDLDMYLYDKPDHYLGDDTEDDDTDKPGCQGCEGVGGVSIDFPERVAFTATQDEYDLVVQATKGAVTRYTLAAYMTDEVFDKPSELLDEITQVTGAAPEAIKQFSPPAAAPSHTLDVPGLDLVSPRPDADIAGIGLGVNEQFASEQVALGGVTRTTAATAAAPSGVSLTLTLGVVPLALAGAGAAAVRRRRRSLT